MRGVVAIKKVLSFIVFMIAVLFATFPVNAARNGKITVGSVAGKPGDVVTVTVSMTDNPGIIAIRLLLKYDSSKVKLISVTDGEIFGKGLSTFGNDLSSNPYSLVWEDALTPKNHTENGTLVTLKFKISESATEGKADVTLSLDSPSTFDVNLNDVNFNISNGNISVLSNGTPGQTASSSTQCAHPESSWQIKTAPTCTADGKKIRTCDSCGLILEVGTVAPTGHKMSKWTVKTHATEKNDGVEFRKCSVCDLEETRAIPKSSVKTTAANTDVTDATQPVYSTVASKPDDKATENSNNSDLTDGASEACTTETVATPCNVSLTDSSEQSDVSVKKVAAVLIIAVALIAVCCLIIAQEYKRTRKEQPK